MEIAESTVKAIRLFNISSESVTLAPDTCTITYRPTGMVDITGGSGGQTPLSVCDERTGGAYRRPISIVATDRGASEIYSVCGETA